MQDLNQGKSYSDIFPILPKIVTWAQIFTTTEIRYHINEREVAYFMFLL